MAATTGSRRSFDIGAAIRYWPLPTAALTRDTRSSLDTQGRHRLYVTALREPPTAHRWRTEPPARPVHSWNGWRWADVSCPIAQLIEIDMAPFEEIVRADDQRQ